LDAQLAERALHDSLGVRDEDTEVAVLGTHPFHQPRGAVAGAEARERAAASFAGGLPPREALGSRALGDRLESLDFLPRKASAARHAEPHDSAAAPER